MITLNNAPELYAGEVFAPDGEGNQDYRLLYRGYAGNQTVLFPVAGRLAAGEDFTTNSGAISTALGTVITAMGYALPA